MKARWFVMVAAVVLLAGTADRACGPFFPNSYLVQDNAGHVLEMPEGDFYHEICRIAGVKPDVKSLGDNEDKIGPAGRTAAADLADLEAALTAGNVEPAKRREIEGRYEGFREPKRVAPLNRRDPLLAFSSKLAARQEALLTQLPVEFALYARGAAAWHDGDREGAVKYWRELLALPEQDRHWRSTWAAFMVGRALLDSDSKTATSFFEQVRRDAAAGGHDSLHLAASSLGWQAFLEERAGRRVEAMKLYFEMLNKADRPEDRHTAACSLRALCSRTFDWDYRVKQTLVARDPLCRRIVTAWMVANYGRQHYFGDGQWLELVTKAAGKKPLEDADRVAWMAYQMGDMKAAARWVDAADPQAPYARWVRSKLLLREGKVDEAIGLLRGLTEAFPRSEEWHDYGNSGEPDGLCRPLAMVHSDLGILLLARQDYVAALDQLLRSGCWPDAAYVAERVLTVEEVEKYLKKQADNKELIVKEPANPECDCPWPGVRSPAYELKYLDAWLPGTSPLEALRYLLARRLARSGEWAQARAYYPPNQLIWFDDFVAHLKAGRDGALPPHKRAEELYLAAWIARSQGMELFGTEDEPDWSVVGGDYELGGAIETRCAGLVSPNWFRENRPIPLAAIPYLLAGKDEVARVAASPIVPDKRFHYRYHAADLMWECAALLPDNDPLLARALWKGGMCLASRDPVAADRFYKALVRRCRQLPVGRQADALRWFPQAPPLPDGFKEPAEPPAAAPEIIGKFGHQ